VTSGGVASSEVSSREISGTEEGDETVEQSSNIWSGLRSRKCIFSARAAEVGAVVELSCEVLPAVFNFWLEVELV